MIYPSNLSLILARGLLAFNLTRPEVPIDVSCITLSPIRSLRNRCYDGLYSRFNANRFDTAATASFAPAVSVILPSALVHEDGSSHV